MLAEREALNAKFDELAAREQLLPIKVTSHYQRLVDEEVAKIGPDGPLYRVAYPSLERMTLRVAGEVPDWIEERSSMPEGLKNVSIRRYADRLLFLSTERCAGNCQYCCRSALLADPEEEWRLLDERLELLDGYLKNNHEIREVIVSGGDPLVLPVQRIEKIFSVIKSNGRDIRIASRMPVFSPHVFRDELTDLLADYDARLFMHCVHPYELSAETCAAIDRLVTARVRVYNQFPLLRNVNDHPKVVLRHLELLDNLRVRNLSIFVAEVLKYSAAFRIPLKRVFSIMDEVNFRSPSWINSTRLVLDTRWGKVRREHLVEGPDADGVTYFQHTGRRVRYVDFPEEHDKPGELDRLLWKG